MSTVSSIALYRSNRTEVLVDALADVLARPASGPLDREWLLVQGRGMAVWLSQQIAIRQGVWAGSELLYPRNFVVRVLEAVLGDECAQAGAFSRSRMVWPLMAILGEADAHPSLSRLAPYLEGEGPQLRRYQLASRIADTFDQYLTYRPDMLLAWERGHDALALELGETWQPVVWRELGKRLGGGHLATLERSLQKTLAAAPAGVSSMPSRVLVFGLATMPPLYVRVLAALARHCEVHWMLPSPCQEYWADLASPTRIERALAEGASLDALHLDQGNPLLGSLGKLGADLLEVMESECEALSVARVEPAGDLHHEPPTDSRLGRLQGDVLNLRPGDHLHHPSDASITLHCCHGPMREVEVLHDQLLALLTDDMALRPRDVVVMMADVDTYAPLVEAVFERDPHDPRFIPYSIADRALRRESPVLDAFLRLLELVKGRLHASEVLDLLAIEPLRRRFGIAADEIDLLTRWITDSQIRWGIDADHRASHGQPAVHENTWRFGLERLLLGYAMPSQGRALFAGALPYDEIEGQEAQLLGRLVAFCEALFDWVRRLGQPRTLQDWRAELLALLEAMLLEDGDSAWEHDRLRQALSDMCSAADSTGEELEIDVLRAALASHLDGLERAHGFLRGGVTFCAMLPMRSIPFRVVALLGMNEGVVPRPRRVAEIDLMARRGQARAGDRNRRDDDRYAFLEALLAARDRLIILFTGQSIRDNTHQNPSLLVTELCDRLRDSEGLEIQLAAAADPAAVASDPFLTRHPLQPFSPRYFDGGDAQLFSFSSASCEGATSLSSGNRASAAPLFGEPLPSVETGAGAVLSLGELTRFFEHPVRHLLQHRLGVVLRERELDVPDREPVALTPLEKHKLGDVLFSLGLAGMQDDATQALARAGGLLPIGIPGACAHEELLALAGPLARRLRELRRGDPREPLDLDRVLADGTRLGGQLDELWSAGLVVGRFVRLSGKHLLSLWIRHLGLCCAGSAAEAPSSFLVGRAETDDAGVAEFRLQPVERPDELLGDLVTLYRVGLREPLRLLPEAAYRYARRLRSGGAKARSGALARAKKDLAKERARDPYLQRVFADTAALDPQAPGLSPAFEELALRVFNPLIDHLDAR